MKNPARGKGWIGKDRLITQELYDSRSRSLKFVPVFLSAPVNEWIPEPLRSVSCYSLTSEANYQNLYDFLLDQAGVEPHPIGTLKIKPRRQGTPHFRRPHPVRGCQGRHLPHRQVRSRELIGREAETQLLNDAWDEVPRLAKSRPHMPHLRRPRRRGKDLARRQVGGGTGRAGLAGCDAAFAWSFYSQGTREQLAASSDLFLKEALTFFGDERTMRGQRRGRVRERPAPGPPRRPAAGLLILDGLEPLQYAPTSPTPGELKDQGIAALLKGLAAASHGLCVVTTRYSLPDLKAFWQTTAPEVKLLRLSRDAGVHLLKTLGVRKGTAQEFADAGGRRERPRAHADPARRTS